MRFAVRGTSRNRLLTGIEESLADTFGGSMHAGAPVAATCPRERALERRPQVARDIDVLPPGSRAVWHDAGQTTTRVIRIDIERIVRYRRLRRVIEYIYEHLGENLTLAELAAIAGISLTHLKNEFKRVIGMPVHRYIVHCRVEYALRQIQTCDIAFSALAQQAGFANQSHMARCMKKIAGVTPSAARECPIVFNTVRM